MLETLLESLDKDVFSAEMVEALVVQFNEAVETKAKEIADAGLTEAIETAVNEALEAKEKELEEKAEGYILEALEAKEKELEEKAEAYNDAKLAEINESLDLYLGKVVDEFILESKDRMNESLKAEKADMIIESFEAMITMGAVDVMKIAEAKDLSYADAKLSESVTKYDDLMTDYLSLQKDNEKLAKLGVINEMKEGLSLVESKKFETLASLVPFSKSDKYAEDLEVIKESVKGSVETKVEDTIIVESKVKTETKVNYSHLV